MGSSLVRGSNPQFEVRALGDWEQKPGCPDSSVEGLSPARLQQLCLGECYHPGDTRRRIDRVEVIRIRPQAFAGEDVAPLVEDPWQVLSCPEGNEGCTVHFSDPEFAAGRRDTLYYVRAVEQATPTVNGDQLRCERDDQGQCVAVNPCRAYAEGDAADDCLADAGERAWSSPIFVDYGETQAGQ
jgi:hypothetical protein